jgi:hypothetical protein
MVGGPTTWVTVGVEALGIPTATQMQRHRREATEASHPERATETWTARLHKGTRTVSVIHMADMTGLGVLAAEVLNTTTIAERGCRIARRTFMHGDWLDVGLWLVENWWRNYHLAASLFFTGTYRTSSETTDDARIDTRKRDAFYEGRPNIADHCKWIQYS